MYQSIRHSLLPVVLLAVAFSATSSYGQGYYGGYVDNKAATVGESYARGVSDMVRSAGQANLLNSAAANGYAEARSKELDNRLQYTNTYFEMKRVNQAYQASQRGPRVTEQDAIRYAHMRAPSALGQNDIDQTTGQLEWPTLLRDDEYTKGREEVQSLLELRAKQGYLKQENREKMYATIGSMQSQLKSKIRDYMPSSYMASKSFLEALMVTTKKLVG